MTALTLDTFNRHPEKVAIAACAQLINCIDSLFLSHEEHFITTPVFHVFDMYKGTRADRPCASSSPCRNHLPRKAIKKQLLYRRRGCRGRPQLALVGAKRLRFAHRESVDPDGCQPPLDGVSSYPDHAERGRYRRFR